MKCEIKKRVCIIGAGPAGLVAIKHISQSSGLIGTVFEASDAFGGVWVYKPKSDPEHCNVLYKNMTTNLPKQLMGFPDFLYPDAFRTIPDGKPAFLHHSDVLQFLHSYTEYFQLLQYIQFQRRVVGLRPVFTSVENTTAPKWRVTVQHTNANTISALEEFEFDAVLVCSGHLSKPKMAEIPNIEEFQGTVLHSKEYDDAEPFKDRRVVIIGCGPSAIGICAEIAQVASEVLISNSRKRIKFELPVNVKEIPGIKSATQQGFICENGDIFTCDAVIMCTGYVFDFPFLTPECKVSLEGSLRLYPLYRDLVHIQYHNLYFVGIQLHVSPFTLFYFQIQYIVRLLQGQFDFPPQEVMLQEMESVRLQRRALNPSLSWSHELGDLQWQHYEALAEEANFPIPSFLPLLQKIFEKTRKRREMVHVYKNDEIYVTDLELHSFSYVNGPP